MYTKDWYSFVRSGLIERCDTAAEAMNLIIHCGNRVEGKLVDLIETALELAKLSDEELDLIKMEIKLNGESR